MGGALKAGGAINGLFNPLANLQSVLSGKGDMFGILAPSPEQIKKNQDAMSGSYNIDYTDGDPDQYKKGVK